ncbi:NAD+ synthase [Balneola sp. MJW-20]|uniref:NAD+ synthase n=1 Tax=Gracilimonas aurantiaca TaxID=3234185 RepID=UPI003466E173
MKIRLSQLNPVIGDLTGNKDKIIRSIQNAEEDGIELLILPELMLTGYPPMDLLEKEAFRESCYQLNREIIDHTGAMTVIFGSITPNHSGVGRKCYNSAIVAANGDQIALVHKALLPTYDVFDDLRYFEPGSEFKPVVIGGVSFGITVCEDIWYNANEINYHIYDVNPAELLVEQGAQAIINISASPFTKYKPHSRRSMLQGHAKKYKRPLFYVNSVGAQTELVFDGDSLIADPQGNMLARAARFEECNLDIHYHAQDQGISILNAEPAALEDPPEEQSIFRALTLGLRDYMEKTGISDKVLVGLSGGIDSALVCAIAAEALGPENVIAVTMPSQFSSSGSVSDSEKLAQNLGIKLHEIAIKDIYDVFMDKLDPLFKDTEFGVAEENLQSRIRGNLLMTLSNKFGYMLLNTGNKSELAVGYCTLYGDMAGGLALISDVYKTEVYSIARWYNEKYHGKEIIPDSIIEKEPSAELRPDQKDTDSLPDYGTLDAVLKYYIEDQSSREEIIAQGIPEEVTDRVIGLVDRNEYKRYQSAPGLKVSPKSFGIGRRWPIVQRWTGHERKLKETEVSNKN